MICGALRGIARHSEQAWGASQRVEYVAAIVECFKILIRHPKIGIVRPDLKAGYRSLPVGRHIIFYQLAGGRVVILRILHQRMDAIQHL
ncbi:MAG: type II toxin-antitoxin system RelE/ParE family toxin [Rhizomicrobium sp.]